MHLDKSNNKRDCLYNMLPCWCSYLKPDKGKKTKCKTHVKKQTLNPVFDEVCHYLCVLSCCAI